MKFHKYANLFPMMSSDEYKALVEDIRQNGQLNSIWIDEGQILDGRNRWKACQELGIEPVVREWDGQAAQIWQRKVNTFWKPILWFIKGRSYDGPWIGDALKSSSNDNDKTHHHWGQSESGILDLIRRFSNRELLILDPFLGGGTTGIVAVGLGHRFIGIDINQKAIDITKNRLERYS